MNKTFGNFKEEWWDLMIERFDNIDKKQDALAVDVIAIKEKMKYIFGFVTGITFVVNIVWAFFKNKWDKL